MAKTKSKKEVSPEKPKRKPPDKKTLASWVTNLPIEADLHEQFLCYAEKNGFNRRSILTKLGASKLLKAFAETQETPATPTGEVKTKEPEEQAPVPAKVSPPETPPTTQPQGQGIRFSDADIELLRNTYADTLTPDEFRMFIAIAKMSGLNPFLGEITVMKVNDEDKKPRMVPMTTIDGYRKLTRDIQIDHWKIEWCGDDEVWKDVWLSKEHPAAARFVGKVKGASDYSSFAVTYDDFVRLKKDGSGPQAMWKKMPARMLAKCAEAGWRRLMKHGDTYGIYVEEEMQQALNPTKKELSKNALEHSGEVPAMKTPQGRETMLELFKKKYPINTGDHKKALNAVFAILGELGYTKEDAYTIYALKWPDNKEKNLKPEDIHFSKMSGEELQEAIGIIAYFDSLHGPQFKRDRDANRSQAETQEKPQEAKPKEIPFERKWYPNQEAPIVSEGIYNLLSESLILETYDKNELAGGERKESKQDFMRRLCNHYRKEEGFKTTQVLLMLIEDLTKVRNNIPDSLLKELKTEKLITMTPPERR